MCNALVPFVPFSCFFFFLFFKTCKIMLLHTTYFEFEPSYIFILKSPHSYTFKFNSIRNFCPKRQKWQNYRCFGIDIIFFVNIIMHSCARVRTKSVGNIQFIDDDLFVNGTDIDIYTIHILCSFQSSINR